MADGIGAAKLQRMAARATLIAAQRTATSSYGVAAATVSTNITAAQTVMSGVSLNSISAQNITDINAALTAAAAALVTGTSAVTTVLTALNTSMVDTAESL